jgi:hypothetical protein
MTGTVGLFQACISSVGLMKKDELVLFPSVFGMPQTMI